ncbi:linoleate diol synthase [Xylariaceae sp. FL0255]|nr:linoleate diol synthase [Xylariaceae sp. FL0255]
MADEKTSNGSNGTSNGSNGAKSYTTTSASTNGKVPASSFGVGPAFKETPEGIPKADRAGIAKAFAQLGQWTHASFRPWPTQTGDGTFAILKRPTLKQDLRTLSKKDIKTVLTIVKNKLSGQQLIDDKTMIMEHTIQLVAGLPSGSRLREELTNNFINELWSTLEHPPLLYIGEKHMYRQADGSWNNPMNPMLGAAGSTYARTCRPSIQVGAMPDPNLIYESVMKRTKYRKHPNNVSSILWYWADIVIHDLFWTDLQDITKTKTSSFLDLSPLYGSNQEMQDSIRTFKDGLMKPDTFADKRLLGQPPGVSVILIMFNRFHNYVAKNLAAINEGGRFTPPPAGMDEEKAAAAWKKYDNDLFQTARLITSGLYINITLVDYVRNIVNLNRSNTTWTLDPRVDAGAESGTFPGAERGTGSMVSAEFNLCYRWHSCISAKDDQWIQDFYRSIFKGKDPLDLSIQDMAMGFIMFDRSIPSDPGQREFGGFKRGPDGKFSDDDLVNCISDSIEDCAGAFGGRNVPECMKPVEILGILQGRKWNVAGLNEFRKHFGLKPYETFEDINSDPEIAGSLQHLYGHPDFVELYPGLVAEEAKSPLVPGVGIAPTYTISRVILSDAVCLTRGDRFYTTDYNPRSLTSWGFNEVAYDLNINQGCVFYKLFIRAFPNHFKRNSVYAHYPMCVPGETKAILTNLGRVQDFDFERPSYIRPSVSVSTYGGAEHILKSQDKYTVNWNESIAELMGTKPSSYTPKEGIHSQVAGGDWNSAVKSYYAKSTSPLILEKSYKLAGQTFVDIVRDVGNFAPTRFAAETYALPLKTAKNPKGVYNEQELYSILASVCVSIFFDIDPVKSFPVRYATKTMTTQLVQLMEAKVKSSGGMFASKPKKPELAAFGAELIKVLSKSGVNNKDIVLNELLPAAAASSPLVAQVFAQAVDYYLSPNGSKHVGEIYAVATQAVSAESDALLLGYIMEAIRLAGTFGSYREATADDVIPGDDGRSTPIKAKDRVYLSFAGASADANNFPNPSEVNPKRPLTSYITFAVGPYAANQASKDAVNSALVEMFRAAFRLKNLRRAPGPQGELKRVKDQDGFDVYMREDRGAYYPFPCTMVVAYDP